jgi:protein-tyrosine phosphatase
MAAALFQSLLEREGLLPGWRVESAGTWSEEGFPATADARRAMEERGIDLSRHRSRAVTAELLDRSDLVLVMETAHLRTLQAQFPRLAGRVHLLTEMLGETYDIEDPVGMGLERYRSLADSLQALFARALPRIQEIVSR